MLIGKLASDLILNGAHIRPQLQYPKPANVTRRIFPRVSAIRLGTRLKAPRGPGPAGRGYRVGQGRTIGIVSMVGQSSRAAIFADCSIVITACMHVISTCISEVKV